MNEKDVKNGLAYFGMGLASLVAADALMKTVRMLEKDGTINKADGDRLVENLEKIKKSGALNKKKGQKSVNYLVRKYRSKGNRYASDLQAQFDSLVKEGVKASPFATKQDMKNLKKQIDSLTKLAMKAMNAQKKAPKKH